MGATADLTKQGDVFNDGNDSIVIRRVDACITGGRTLDLTGFTEKHVRAGHILIREKETDTYKPLAVSNGAYATLPDGHEYVGVLRASIPSDLPFAAIMYAGEVNNVASPYPLTDTLKAAIKAVLPGLYFMHD